MPKYAYFCKECEEVFEKAHSLQETLLNCEKCGSMDSLERKPSEIFLTKKQNKFAQTFEAGQLVKEAIEDTKQDTQQEQNRLKNRVYKK